MNIESYKGDKELSSRNKRYCKGFAEERKDQLPKVAKVVFEGFPENPTFSCLGPEHKGGQTYFFILNS